MTLNRIIAVILSYFTELDRLRGQLRQCGWS